jgi:hypothetical protein
MGYLDEKFTKPPEDRDSQAQNTATTETSQVAERQTQATEQAATQQTEQAQSQTVETPKPDEFIENLNKRFGTQFKAEDEIKGAFGLQPKIVEYETNAKDFATKIEQYEKQLEEYKNKDNSEFLSKPLIRKAFVADQLLTKYPDKDPFALQEIAMADVDKMSDLDVLVKNQKINHPRLAEADIKAVLFKKHGIDPETKPEEWDSIARTEIAMDAENARANIKALTNGIELPKTATKEERERQANESLQRRTQAVEPLKAEFSAFDKFKIGDFEYDPSSDFKAKLPDMFQAMFIDAGLEPTDENKKTAIELRDMTFLYQNFDKIKEVITKQAQTEIQKKLDEALHNTQPPNTATATDEGGNVQTLTGLGKFLEDNK